MFDDVIQEAIEKTLKELNQPPELAKQNSRNWTDPEGYRFLYPWSNAVLLRYFVRLFTESLPKSEYRRKAQVDDAARSTVRNIEEGFKRATTKEYLEFLGFSQGSLEEVKGDVRESVEDEFLKSVPGSSLVGLGIDLKEFNYALRRPRQLKEGRGTLEEGREEMENSGTFASYRPLNSSKNPLTPINLKDTKGSIKDDMFAYHPITVLYPPLKNITADQLTYEIFTELINKTDFMLRNLVVSLEKKLNADHKGYQIDKIRLNRRAGGR